LKSDDQYCRFAVHTSTFQFQGRKQLETSRGLFAKPKKENQTMIKSRRFVFASLSGLAVLFVALLVVGGVRAAGADHVRWDIINLAFTTPPTVSAGGVAFASADANLTIELTGTGTFVSPASGGTSSAVTGGGTWETFTSGVSTGSGTYAVTSLSSWEFANLQTPGAIIDLIGSGGANGNAILRIQYSDGSSGILGIGCHGPGAPDGIQEGVIATKDFVTYWTRQAPAPGVNANRTSFHIE
jgi:hypothetical protein